MTSHIIKHCLVDFNLGCRKNFKMGRKCAITGCVNYTDKPINTVHLFPKSNPYMRKRWIEFVKMASNLEVEKVNLDNFGICVRHFSSSSHACIQTEECRTERSRTDVLKPTAVPTLLGSVNAVVDDYFRYEHDYCLASPSTKASKLHDLEIEALHWEIHVQKSAIKEKDHVVQKLRKNVSHLKRKCDATNAKLKEAHSRQISVEDENLLKRVREIFTPGQLRLMSNPDLHHVHWSDEEKSKFIASHSVSTKLYTYQRDIQKFPLPSSRTIYGWLQDAVLTPDQLLPPVMNILKEKLKDTTPMWRMCCIAIDEMSIDMRYCYDPNNDRIYGMAKNVTVITLRGLFFDWKEVIYFTFDSAISVAILKHIIEELYSINAEVVSVTTDMGTKNVGLWKALGVGLSKDGKLKNTKFDHPVTKKNVWIFPDLPHLIKNLRNHTLDSKITLEDGTVVDKKLFQDLIDKQKYEYKLAHKITHKHINVRYRQRQAVAPAFQLYSHRVSEAFKFIYPADETKHKQADFIQLVNDFCDLSNTRGKKATESYYTSPYGMFQKEQDELYEQAYQTFSTMRVGERSNKSFAPFQRGLLMYILSIRGLLQDMKKSPVNAEFIMTHKVNQDVLENVFSRLRGFGHFHTNPNALEVITRIKKLLLCWNFVDSNRTSVEIEPSCPSKVDCSTFLKAPRCETVVQPLNKTTEELISKIGSDIESTPLVFENFGILSRIEEGGREYISGFIAGELQKEYPHLSKRGAREYRESFWVGRLSGGGLVEPSLPWHDVFKKFDIYFETFHGFSSIYKGSGAYKQLEDILIANFPNIEEKIIKYFVRVRTNIRIAHLNKKIEDDKFKYQVSRREKVASDGNPEEGSEMSERAEGIYHILSTNF